MHDLLQQAAGWVVPSLVGAAIFYLRSINSSIQELNRNLAVAVERLDGLERRIEVIEEHILKRSR